MVHDMMKERSRFQDDRGAVIVLFALVLVALMTAAAFVIDLGNARQISRNEQVATDAAALAAVQDLGITPGNSEQLAARNSARKYVLSSLGVATDTAPPCASGTNPCTFTAGVHSVSVVTPYTLAGSVIDPKYLVRVEACRLAPAIFGRVAGSNGQTVCRSSVARVIDRLTGYGIGLVTIDPTACPGLQFGGSTDTDLTTTGAILVDSNCTTGSQHALDTNGCKWSATAGLVSIVGDFSYSGCAPDQQIDPATPLVGQAPVGDPFAGLQEPVLPTTDSSLVGTCSSGKDRICPPGKYPAAQTFNSVDTVVLQPGIHYFEQGVDFKGATVTVSGPPNPLTGTGVLVFVKQGGFDLIGNGSHNIPPTPARPAAVTAPTDSTMPYYYEGISVFLSRSNTSTSDVKINGNTGTVYGSIYVPNQMLVLNGSSSWTITGSVVAKTALITGNMKLNILPNPPPTFVPPSPDIGLER